MHSIWFLILAIFSIALMAFLLFLVLFERGLSYRVQSPGLPIDSDAFLCLLGAGGDARVHGDSRVEVLWGGEVFYGAELAAIRAARRSVHIEAFLFIPGAITDRFLEALSER